MKRARDFTDYAAARQSKFHAMRIHAARRLLAKWSKKPAVILNAAFGGVATKAE